MLLATQPVIAFSPIQLILLDPGPQRRLVTPSDAATSLTFRPERTIWTASRRNSSGYGGRDIGMLDTILSRLVQRKPSGVRKIGGIPSWSREHASVCRGLMCSLRTFARPFTWSTTKLWSRKTRMRWIPRLRASFSPSMRARYSATVLMAGPIRLEISAIR